MHQTPSPEQLADRVVRLEDEVKLIQQELAELRRHTEAVPAATILHVARNSPWADKGAQRHWINHLFAALSIQGVPIGAEALQQRMSQAGLTPNELSRGPIEAREE